MYVSAARLFIIAVVAPVLHRYVGFAALVLTVAVPFGFTQLVFATGVQFAVGGVDVDATIAEHVAVHPVVVLVTVTVYVPAARLLIIAVVSLLLHKYVTPVAVAVAVPFGFIQFVLSVLAQLTIGLVILSVIIASQVFVQPVVVLVTVTV